MKKIYIGAGHGDHGHDCDKYNDEKSVHLIVV